MKTITKESQLFHVMTSRKEAIKYLNDYLLDYVWDSYDENDNHKPDYKGEEDNVFIYFETKNGKIYCINNELLDDIMKYGKPTKNDLEKWYIKSHILNSITKMIIEDAWCFTIYNANIVCFDEEENYWVAK
jgi:hypothetical protein